uniref:Uncharacterized protein n=1 Tax=Amphimedon queenslandica TaxID=400682 RepID=A0A1X7V3Z0_AMPQE
MGLKLLSTPSSFFSRSHLSPLVLGSVCLQIFPMPLTPFIGLSSSRKSSLVFHLSPYGLNVGMEISPAFSLVIIPSLAVVESDRVILVASLPSPSVFLSLKGSRPKSLSSSTLGYLDDGSLCDSPTALLKALDIIDEVKPSHCLSHDRSKCLIFAPQASLPYLVPLPDKILFNSDGFVVLGAPVGPQLLCFCQ